MSTAHRPTWHNAIGHGPTDNFVSFKVSSRDMPSHTELKRRAPVALLATDDDAPKSQKINEHKKLLKAKLEDTEKAHRARNEIEERVGVTRNFISLEDAVKLLNQDINAFPQDEDDVDADDAVGRPNGANDGDDDDDDEEALLLRELEKIKSEKEQARQEQLQQEREQESKDAVLNSNPLLAKNSGTFKRWDEDVVFKNPVKECKKKPEFINDMVKSAFHKRFLHKYIT